MAQDIVQKVTFDAKPAVIYGALMSSKHHSAFTGAPAKVEAVVGGKVSAWGGYISAINVELVKGSRIVQAWRGENWPKGAWSIVRFELAPAGTGQTRLTFSQSGVPDEHAKDIAAGWKSRYWQMIDKWLGATKKQPKRAAPRAKKTKKK
jgi:activator of HSP90 ATPase